MNKAMLFLEELAFSHLLKKLYRMDVTTTYILKRNVKENLVDWVNTVAHLVSSLKKCLAIFLL
jgi:hypothetical protein